MSESADRVAGLPMGADMANWAANEVAKHEEICGLRYEAIARDMKAMRECMDADRGAAAARSKAIEDKIGGAVKYVLGILGSMAVALVLMVVSNGQATKAADESDKREMRARLSLLTSQLQNMAPRGTVVVAPQGTQTTTFPAPETPAPDQDDLSTAAGAKGNR